MNLQELKISGLVPKFPGPLKKNDALFAFGASSVNLPFVYAYEQSMTEVVHGPSCKVENEINIANCTKNNVPIIARRGGGGTVVLSEGMCILLIVGEKNDHSTLDIYKQIHDAVINVVSDLCDKTIEQSGISDLAIDGQKILGSSLYLGNHPPLYYYQSSLMVSSDLDLLETYLFHPPREPDYRQNRSHKSFCTTLQKSGFTVSAKTLCEIFNNTLSKML
jgi:lipoate-protein ligase A